ncbi:hypothetical protein FKM82_006695 [Ascaphus truei]
MHRGLLHAHPPPLLLSPARVPTHPPGSCCRGLPPPPSPTLYPSSPPSTGSDRTNPARRPFPLLHPVVTEETERGAGERFAKKKRESSVCAASFLYTLHRSAAREESVRLPLSLPYIEAIHMLLCVG